MSIGYSGAAGRYYLFANGDMHKLGNILDKLPKRLQPRVKAALHEVMYAETRAQAHDLRGLPTGGLPSPALAVAHDQGMAVLVTLSAMASTYAATSASSAAMSMRRAPSRAISSRSDCPFHLVRRLGADDSDSFPRTLGGSGRSGGRNAATGMGSMIHNIGSYLAALGRYAHGRLNTLYMGYPPSKHARRHILIAIS